VKSLNAFNVLVIRCVGINNISIKIQNDEKDGGIIPKRKGEIA